MKFCSVVGYQKKDMRAAYNYLVNTMRTIGKTRAEMTLADVKPSADFVNSTIQILGSNGASATMTVYNEEQEPVYEDVECIFYYGEGEGGLGWYQMDDWNNDGGLYPQDAYPLKFGQGYCVERAVSEPDALITFDGEVETSSYTANFDEAGYNYIGNCSPKDITLKDLKVSSDFVNSTIQILAANGASDTMTVYNEEEEPVYEDVECIFYYGIGEAGAGWYQMDDWNNDGGLYPQNDFEVKAGSGFCVERAVSEPDATIEIPSAL